jgi:hypothetical protein
VQGFTIPIELFGEENVATDGDVSEIVISLGGSDQPDGTKGTVWENGNSHWSVVSACEETPQGNHVGYFRFLGESGNPIYMSSKYFFGDPDKDIQFPKVAAAFFTKSGQLPWPNWYIFVEVAVVFQVWNEDTGTWDLAIEIFRFEPVHFAPGQLDQIVQIGDPTLRILDEDVNCMYPDVAYNPFRGHILIVYSRDDHPGARVVYFRQGLRSDPYININWNTSRYPAQNFSHNGFHPRIDVGWIQTYQQPLQWMAAIVYTGAHDDRWRPWYNYWPVILQQPTLVNDQEIMFPDVIYDDHAGGLPVLDIGPPGSNFAAVVWNQAKDTQNPQNWQNVSVAYIDTKGCWCLFTLPDDPETLSSYPSICIHNNDSEHPQASVSYLYKDPDTNGHWEPRMRLIDSGNPLYLHNPTGFDLFVIYGDWQPLDCITNWFGMSTSLIVYPGNWYWMTWTSMLPGDAEPCHVHGAFGFTEE